VKNGLSSSIAGKVGASEFFVRSSECGNKAQSLWGIVPILLCRARFGGVSGTLISVVWRKPVWLVITPNNTHCVKNKLSMVPREHSGDWTSLGVPLNPPALQNLRHTVERRCWVVAYGEV